MSIVSTLRDFSLWQSFCVFLKKYVFINLFVVDMPDSQMYATSSSTFVPGEFQGVNLGHYWTWVTMLACVVSMFTHWAIPIVHNFVDS